MITVEQIRLKAERSYLSFLQSWLGGESYIPLSFPVGEIPSNFVQYRTAAQQLQDHSKAVLGHGYEFETHQKQKRSLGLQTIPVRIVLKTAEDFLYLIEKEHEFKCFQQDVELIRKQGLQLEDWMQHYPKKVIEQHGCWPNLLAVCHYFLENPRPGLYIRELPISVHTKFVEEHIGILRELLEHLLPEESIARDGLTFQQRFGLREEDPLVRVRFLDDQLCKRYGLPLNDLCTPCSQFAELELRGQSCIITENKKTFLTLPSLPNTFAIQGGGFGVSTLAAIPWLSECLIFYWGDIDAQGFQILSQLRSIFPHVTSLMMDEATLETFTEFCVEGTPCLVRQLPSLTLEEHALFLLLAERNIRLEQERISHVYALEQINRSLMSMGDGRLSKKGFYL